MTAMAMFPLGLVLLPGEILPLHIFESRYRQMVADLTGGDGPPEFGQVLITRGTETGGRDERAHVGCVARVVQVDALHDGRFAMLALGSRRMRIASWLLDDPYPRADVEDWPDGDDGTADLGDALLDTARRVREVRGLAVELGDVPADVDHRKMASDPVAATYHLVSRAPVGAADRFRLLAAPGPAARVELLHACLDEVEAMLQFRLS